MIEVNINIGAKRRIAQLLIINDGTGSIKVGNYKVKLRQEYGHREHIVETEIKGFSRQRYDVIKLIEAAIKSLSKSNCWDGRLKGDEGI